MNWPLVLGATVGAAASPPRDAVGGGAVGVGRLAVGVGGLAVGADAGSVADGAVALPDADADWVVVCVGDCDPLPLPS